MTILVLNLKCIYSCRIPIRNPRYTLTRSRKVIYLQVQAIWAGQPACMRRAAFRSTPLRHINIIDVPYRPNLLPVVLFERACLAVFIQWDGKRNWNCSDYNHTEICPDMKYKLTGRTSSRKLTITLLINPQSKTSKWHATGLD